MSKLGSEVRCPCLPNPAPLAALYGLACGTLEAGKGNTIADVAGVTVGHFTLRDGDLRTGFTALLPHQGNLFCEKLTAAVEVINGFGKSAGLVQVDELGTLETPVLLTNTFGVGTGVNALIRRAISENPEIGRSTGTVNPVVLECNDGYLSDIQAMALTEAHVVAAIEAASESFEQGSVGAGTGMSAFGFKGGIGSASRVYELDGRRFTLGALVLANFGRPGDLVLPDGGRPHPKDLKRAEERGSVIVVLATDVPLESRQLKRIAKAPGPALRVWAPFTAMAAATSRWRSPRQGASPICFERFCRARDTRGGQDRHSVPGGRRRRRRKRCSTR
ncbi:P1 family peptidase [Novosphingobium sp. MW5]|nr:P1 family peptidase [Novosphingobium sp. MW5]